MPCIHVCKRQGDGEREREREIESKRVDVEAKRHRKESGENSFVKGEEKKNPLKVREEIHAHVNSMYSNGLLCNEAVLTTASIQTHTYTHVSLGDEGRQVTVIYLHHPLPLFIIVVLVVAEREKLL